MKLKEAHLRILAPLGRIRVVNSGSDKFIGCDHGLMADMHRNQCENEREVEVCDTLASTLVHSYNVLPEVVRELESIVAWLADMHQPGLCVELRGKIAAAKATLEKANTITP